MVAIGGHKEILSIYRVAFADREMSQNFADRVGTLILEKNDHYTEYTVDWQHRVMDFSTRPLRFVRAQAIPSPRAYL